MTENYVDPTRDAFRAFRSLNTEGEIHMLNLVRLRQTAVYPQQHARHGQAVSGEEAYRAYGEESGPILKAVGGSIAYSANFEFVLIGPDNECWDIVLLPSTLQPTRSFRWLKIPIISKLWYIGRQQCVLPG